MVQPDDVQKLLNSLPDASNVDVLGMDSSLLRLGSTVLSKSVCKGVKLCKLSSGLVPPGYKNEGSQMECGNYRTI